MRVSVENNKIVRGQSPLTILFINPFVSPEETYGKFRKLGAVQPPLGMCYIAALLEKYDYQVSILDANLLGLTPEKVIEKALKVKPDLIGLYSTTMGYNKVRDLAKTLKSKRPEIPIVVGGPHVSGMAEETLQETCFDYGVIGEGEITVLELIKALEENKNLREVDGLVYRKEGKVVRNSPRKMIENLDTLPFPARHLLPPLKRYHLKAMITKRFPATHIFTSRGCPYNCIFCGHSFGKKLRFHSPEYVVNEMEELAKKCGIKEITINDDTFTVSKKRVYIICELLRKKRLGIVWSCLIRVDNVDKPLLKAMKRAGCWLVQPGIESGNQEVLDFIRKDITLEEARNACRWAKEVGIQVKDSFILGHPRETRETIEETIEFAKSLKTHFAAFALMTPYPGTELWQIADQYGTLDKSDLSKLVPSIQASFVPFGLTAEYLKKKQAEAYRRCYLNPGMIARHLISIRGWEDIRKMFYAAQALISKD